MHCYQKLSCVALIISFNANANNQDTELRLTQQTAEQQIQADEKTLANADKLNQTVTQANSNNVGAILYQALQQHNWQRAREVLVTYEQSPQADALLIAYARGTLARVDGDYDLAIRYLQDVIDKSPEDFLLPRLALGRAQFEDHQDQNAQQTFTKTSASLDRNADYQQGVIQTVDSFLAALERRQGWHGSLSISITHNDNINQSSERRDCLVKAGKSCLFERVVPEPIQSKGIGFEGVIERRFALSGHHGAFVRGIAFGDIYQNHVDYNNQQLILSTGYSYQDVNDDWTISPIFSSTRQANQTEHRTWGVDVAWRHTLSNDRWFRLGANVEHQSYRQSLSHNDGNLYSLNAGLWQSINNDWLLFGQLRASHKNAQAGVDSYQEGNLRLGVLKNFSSDFSLTLQAGLRHRQYDEFSAVLGERREDTQQTYNAKLSVPKWSFGGFEPSFQVEHTRSHSNVDWLYSYQNTEVSLQVEKHF